MCTDADEKKILLEHKYQVRRLWLDKILLGLIVGVFGIFASMYMESFKNGLNHDMETFKNGLSVDMERFKNSLNRNRFLLESRLTALREIRKKYSVLSADYFYLARAKEGEKEGRRNQYKNDLDLFMSSVNEWTMLFSEQFNK